MQRSHKLTPVPLGEVAANRRGVGPLEPVHAGLRCPINTVADYAAIATVCTALRVVLALRIIGLLPLLGKEHESCLDIKGIANQRLTRSGIGG